jgi:hypothetical protein
MRGVTFVGWVGCSGQTIVRVKPSPGCNVKLVVNDSLAAFFATKV